MPQSIEVALDSYCSYLKRVKQRNELTIAHYHDYLERFFISCAIETTADISLRKIESFRKTLMNDGLAPTTQNYYRIAIRNFIRWLPKSEQRLNYRSITLAAQISRPASTLPREAITSLLSRTPRTRDAASLRDRALLELLWCTDVKLYELPLLRIDSFDRGKKCITVSETLRRVLPLSNHAAWYLTEYLKLRSDQSPYLFIRHDRANGRNKGTPQRLSTRSIQRLIVRHGKRTGQRASITVRSIQNTRAQNAR